MNSDLSQKVINRSFKGLIQATILFGALFGISLLQQSDASRIAWIRAAAFSIILVFGYSGKNLFDDIRPTKFGQKYHPIGSAAGIIIAGLGLWLTLIPFNEFRVWPGKCALILLCGVIGYSASRLAMYRDENDEGFLASCLKWLEHTPKLKFLFGILIGLYLIYIRPYMTIDEESLILGEWIVLCLLTFVILFRVTTHLIKTNTSETVGSNWKQHEPDAERLIGKEHEQMLRIEQLFIENGDPANLLILMTILLDGNDVDEKNIRSILQPLISFTGINEKRQTVLMTDSRRTKELVYRQKVINEIYANINSAIPLHRSDILWQSDGSNNTADTEDSFESLRDRFLFGTDTGGLIIYLTLLMHHEGRRQEYILWTLRGLTDNSGKPSEAGLNTVLSKLNGVPAAGKPV